MFSTVRQCVRVRARECRFVCPRRNQDFKTTKHPHTPPRGFVFGRYKYFNNARAPSSLVGVFQIRSTHSHNNSIYAATAEYYIIIIRPTRTPLYSNTYIILFLTNAVYRVRYK